MKHEWKKQEKELYQPKGKPEVVEVPAMNFFTIRGEGHPESEAFQACVEALYAASYTVRMSHKGKHKPDGYFEYTVYPLEGVWDLIDYSKGSLDKTNFKYHLMIRQPEFLTEEQADFFLDMARKKKKLPALEWVDFAAFDDGKCIQMLHVGPYDDEPASFATMEAFCETQGLSRKSKVHREIYLSDFRKTAPEKLKTILRFQTL
jgi:hypothetical protein